MGGKYRRTVFLSIRIKITNSRVGIGVSYERRPSDRVYVVQCDGRGARLTELRRQGFDKEAYRNGRDAIIDGGTLGKRKIVDTAPSSSSTIDTFLDRTKGADDVELWEGGYLENSSSGDFSLNIGRNFIGNPKGGGMIGASYL